MNELYTMDTMFLIINRKKKIWHNIISSISTLMYNTDILKIIKNICEESYTLFKSSSAFKTISTSNNKISNQLGLLIRDFEK